MDNYPIIPDTRMYFFSTINREQTEFEVDMSQDPIGGEIECIVMTGVHRGETRMHPWLSLNTLWEQQQEGDDDE